MESELAECNLIIISRNLSAKLNVLSGLIYGIRLAINCLAVANPLGRPCIRVYRLLRVIVKS